MFKLIILVLGLAIGFGGGVWWGHKNPEAAAKLSAEEERRVIEASIALNKKMQATLDKLQNKTPAPGSGFVGSGQAGGSAAAEVTDLKADAKKQEAELTAALEKVK